MEVVFHNGESGRDGEEEVWNLLAPHPGSEEVNTDPVIFACRRHIVRSTLPKVAKQAPESLRNICSIRFTGQGSPEGETKPTAWSGESDALASRMPGA